MHFICIFEIQVYVKPVDTKREFLEEKKNKKIIRFLIVTALFIGRSTIGAVWQAGYIYTGEVYPTSRRFHCAVVLVGN